MNHANNPIARIAMWAVMVLGALFTIMIWTGSDAGISGGLWLTYVAMAIATLSTLLFAVMGINRKALIGIGAFAVLLLVAYLMADGDTRPEWEISSNASKWAGAGIGMALLGIAGAVGTIVYGEVTRLFK